MARSFPRDVLVLDSESLIHARLARGKKDPRIAQAKSYRLAANTFLPAVVTPELINEASLAETLRRVRLDSGRLDKTSLLLPDSWFRINILELPSLPDSPKAGEEMVRWSLKRTMPIDPAVLRISYETLGRTSGHTKVLALCAIDKTLAAIEQVFAAAGMEIVIIEPIGLNLWNAITVREGHTTGDRIFFYIREGDFTTAAFRGQQPLFIRSRNLNGERNIEQEIKLSASYLRDTLRTETVEQCYVAGSGVDAELSAAIESEFGAPVRRISLSDLVEGWPEEMAAHDAELAACTGVFAA